MMAIYVNPATVLAVVWLVGIISMIDWSGLGGGGIGGAA